MGYSYYKLADGREAGYSVDAKCDVPECEEEINRGLAYLCGENPLVGPRGFTDWGCGNYHCPTHDSDHECFNPPCGAHSATGNLYCLELKGHALPHYDKDMVESFTETEEDLELE